MEAKTDEVIVVYTIIIIIMQNKSVMESYGVA